MTVLRDKLGFVSIHERMKLSVTTISYLPLFSWSHFLKNASVVAGGLLAAALVWALPSSALQARLSGRTCHRYPSAGDIEARLLVRDAEVAAETLAIEHRGVYTNVSPATIHTLEPEIPISHQQARHKHQDAYLLSASGTKSSYVVTTRSQNGDTYTIRNSSGEMKHYADVCGKARDW
jgi:hypothetical protein